MGWGRRERWGRGAVPLLLLVIAAAAGAAGAGFQPEELAAVVALPAEKRCPGVDVRPACLPEDEDSEEGCPDGTLGPRGFRQEFWKQKPVLLQGAAKEWGEVLGGGFPVDRDKFVERFGNDTILLKSKGADIIAPEIDIIQRKTFREAVQEITAPGSQKIVLDVESMYTLDELVHKEFRNSPEAFTPELTPWLWEALGGGQTRLRPHGYPPLNAQIRRSVGGEAPEDAPDPLLYLDIISLASTGKGGSAPWHFHGEAFLTLLWGAKQWGVLPFGSLTAEVRGSWLTPPGEWHEKVWPNIQDPDTKAVSAPCVQVPGETMYVPPNYHHLTRNLDLTFGLGEHHEGLIANDEQELTGSWHFGDPLPANLLRAVEKKDVGAMITYANALQNEESAKIYERLVELDPTDMKARSKVIDKAIKDGAPVSVVGAMFQDTWDTLDTAAPLATSIAFKVSFLKVLIDTSEDEALLTDLALPLLEKMLEDNRDSSRYAAPVLGAMADYKVVHNDRFGPQTSRAQEEAFVEASRFAQRALECDLDLLHNMDIQKLQELASMGSEVAREQDMRSRGGDL